MTNDQLQTELRALRERIATLEALVFPKLGTTDEKTLMERRAIEMLANPEAWNRKMGVRERRRKTKITGNG